MAERYALPDPEPQPEQQVPVAQAVVADFFPGLTPRGEKDQTGGGGAHPPAAAPAAAAPALFAPVQGVVVQQPVVATIVSAQPGYGVADSWPQSQANPVVVQSARPASVTCCRKIGHVIPNWNQRTMSSRNVLSEGSPPPYPERGRVRE